MSGGPHGGERPAPKCGFAHRSSPAFLLCSVSVDCMNTNGVRESTYLDGVLSTTCEFHLSCRPEGHWKEPGDEVTPFPTRLLPQVPQPILNCLPPSSSSAGSSSH